MRPFPTESTEDLLRQNLRLVKQLCPRITRRDLTSLRNLTQSLRLSISGGELLSVDGKWYVSHTGLLRIALRRRCQGIRTTLLYRLSDPDTRRWVFKATVYKTPGSKGFVGYGDADPSNVSPMVRGAEMRVAETRAVNRALRKAYGIGLCSVEELGSFSVPFDSSREKQNPCRSANGNRPNHGQPRLRDQLCLLIRKHQLDPTLVKRYAAEFCGTAALRDASRDLVASFITHLGEWAARDREGLICKLTSFAEPQEANP
jgi:hypothetical protein